jgi:hypothetical protein
MLSSLGFFRLFLDEGHRGRREESRLVSQRGVARLGRCAALIMRAPVTRALRPRDGEAIIPRVADVSRCFRDLADRVAGAAECHGDLPGWNSGAGEFVRQADSREQIIHRKARRDEYGIGSTGNLKRLLVRDSSGIQHQTVSPGPAGTLQRLFRAVAPFDRHLWRQSGLYPPARPVERRSLEDIQIGQEDMTAGRGEFAGEQSRE